LLLASTSLAFISPQTVHAADTVYNSGATTVSTADTASNFIIGDTGTAAVNVTSPGSLTTPNDITVGNTAAGIGTLTAVGTGLTANRFYIGLNGTGTLTVTNGGTVTASGVDRKIYLGYFGGSTGTLNLSGGATRLTAYDLNVGWSGTGAMTIADGAQATIQQDVTLGKNAYSNGELTVTGSGSSVTSDRLYVGEIGTGTLNILNGASYRLTGTSRMYIGNTAGSRGTVNVSGTGSSLTTTDYLVVGWNGTGNMTVQDGATTTVATDVFVGAYGPSTGTLTVTGSGSSLTADRIYLGDSGTGTLYVLNGGSVTATGTGRIYLGNTSAGKGYATISGAGSTLSGVEVNIGWNDTGNVTVTNSGAINTTGHISVGYYSGSTGTLTVSNGGTVTANNGSGTIDVAVNSGSSGTINLGAAEGTAPTSAGTINAGTIAFGSGTGSIVFNHTNSDYVLSSAVTGSGSIKSVAGSTSLTGDYSGYTGNVTVNGGVLSVDTSSFASSAFFANHGGTLRVNGAVSGVADTVTMNGGTLINNGSISGTQYGVLVSGSGSSIVTSGYTTGGTAAIHYSADGNNLTILPGASFGNVIDYNNTTGNITTFGAGSYSIPVAQYQTAGNTVRLNNTRQAVLYSNAASGSGKITVADAGANASMAKSLQAITSSVSSVLSDISSLNVVRNGSSRANTGLEEHVEESWDDGDQIAFARDEGVKIDHNDNLFWTRGFGGNHVDVYSKTTASHYGVAMGADHDFGQTRLGVMAGYGDLSNSADDGTSKVYGDSVLGGLYMRHTISGYNLDATAIAGSITSHSKRQVNGATETARGDFDGWFISPEVALSRDYELPLGWTVTPKGTVSYSHGSFDGYTERGSSMNLTYDDRTTDAVQGAFEVKLSTESQLADGKIAMLSLSGTVLNTYNMGETDLNASLQGTNFSVSTMGKRNVVGGRLGITAGLQADDRTTLFAGINGGRYSDDSREFNSTGGLMIRF